MRLKALIFDVDGTLAETEELHRQAFNEIFVESGLGWYWSKATYAHLLGTTGGIERMRRYRDALGAALPDDDDVVALHALKTRRYGALLVKGALDLRPGVRHTIEIARAAGLKLGVATTTSRENVESLCQCCWRQPASLVFDVIAAGDEVTAKKPAPDIYLLALRRLGLEAVEAIAIEDSDNGIRSARAAGLPVAVTPSNYTEKEITGGSFAQLALTRTELAALRTSWERQVAIATADDQ